MTIPELPPAKSTSLLSLRDWVGLASGAGIWAGILAVAALLFGFWSYPSWGMNDAAKPGLIAAIMEDERVVSAEADGAATRVTTFDDVKFDIKKGDPFVRSMLPAKIEQMKGTKIKIRGYMLPSFKQKGITEFVLVRDNMECCFGPGAALYDCILIHMTPGNTATFSTRPITVEGVFTIEEFKDPEGKHLAIYRMDATSAQ